MRQIRLYFDSDDNTIGYHIDLDTKHLKMGKVGSDGLFVEVVQDGGYSNPSDLLRQIQTLLAIEINR